ncbi:DUF6318 family protein [Cellulomonas wangsupingiae]|uniref:DUF6318 family protein n=1 Tax=Cellulomonas wangsupingiae TaxID=2968085 RepID=A0ABY5K332_9CELL|nr:DUF6318 family protein [Cellulomonas wangsupingiae]UUI64864.1 DUF6318 family protein [Cellulomonas wangsupingiae]
MVLIGMLAAGCTGGSDPAEAGATKSNAATGASSSPTPSASTTTLDAIVAPSPPSDAASPTAGSAQDTATYFLQLYPYVYWTGDLAEWDRLAAPTCIYCSKTRDDVSRLTDAGHRVTGGAIEITDAQSDEVEAGALFSVFVHFSEAPSQELDGSGAAVAASEGGRFTGLVAMRWTGADWSVDAVDVSSIS